MDQHARQAAVRLGNSRPTPPTGNAADADPTVSPDYPVLSGEPTDFTASINAYANQADRDAALAKLNSLGHFRGAQGPTWIVTCDEDPAVEQQVIRLTGGQQLGTIG